MGKISDLWKKIKGRFNKNKALPEGKEILDVNSKDVELAESEQKINAHEQFTKEIKDKAKEFNPNTMSKEDAIMKILEERGLNREFAKNPVAKSKISDIAEKMLSSQGIERIMPENLEDARSVLSGYSSYRNGGEQIETGIFEISDNGNLKYKMNTNNYQGLENNKGEGKINFSIKDNSLFIDEYVTSKYKNIEDMTKSGSEYNKDGVEMSKYYSHMSIIDGKRQLDNEKCWKLERNSDLVTAKLTANKYDNIISQMNINNDQRFANVSLKTSKPEVLDCSVNYIFDSYKKLGELEETNKTFENGFIEFDKSTPEKAYRVSEQNKKLENARNEMISKSPAFRKLAEEKGLIHEETQEIED